MASGGRYKVGISTLPLRRMKGFQTGNPDGLRLVFCLEIENAKEIEDELKERLNYCRGEGGGTEWFEVPFATVFEQITTLRHLFVIRGESARELPLQSPTQPPAPQLAEHPDFEAWLLRFYEESDTPDMTLQELWETHREDFLASKSGSEPFETAREKDERARAKFASLRKIIEATAPKF